MVHMHTHGPHWPYWVEQIFSEAEQEGPVQMLGVVFAVTIMLAALVLAISTLILEVA